MLQELRAQYPCQHHIPLYVARVYIYLLQTDYGDRPDRNGSLS